ncbi:MbtH family protein [Streptomyces sp. NPDC014684]|uniref:MbtH family protein n=1 Tax=Streptomyces sp. NPDC014684 TaxID=3364880 RepID=UPI0036F75448
MFEDGGDRVYHVVVNEEEQYSIWPIDKPVPAGWRTAGFEGAKQECLQHIETVWTDMRPRSLRLALAEGVDGR